MGIFKLIALVGIRHSLIHLLALDAGAGCIAWMELSSTGAVGNDVTLSIAVSMFFVKDSR